MQPESHNDVPQEGDTLQGIIQVLFIRNQRDILEKRDYVVILQEIRDGGRNNED